MVQHRKPWYRPRNVILGLLAVLVFIVARHTWRSLTATPGSSVNYGAELTRLAESVAPGATLEDNAAPLLGRASRLQQDSRDELLHENPDLSESFHAEYFLLWTPFDQKEPAATGNVYGDEDDYHRRRDLALQQLELYERNGVFDVLAEIARKPALIRPTAQGRLLEMLLPDLGSVRDLARACGARMRLARESGDAASFASAFEQALGTGRVLTTDPVLISHLVGLAVIDLALGELRSAIVAGEVPPGALESVAASLERHARIQPISFPLKGERLSTLDIIQWTHTDDGNGNGRRIIGKSRELQSFAGNAPPAGIMSGSILNLASPMYPSKRTITAKAEDFYTRLFEYADTAPADRRPLPWDPDAYADTLPWNYDILKLLIPALKTAVRSHDRVRNDLEGMRLLVAIERHRASEGSLPASLESLVPTYVPSLPRDSFAPPGTSYVYRVLASPDPQGRAYLLYSVGENGRDDAGVETPPAPKPGGDPSREPPPDRVINRADTPP